MAFFTPLFTGTAPTSTHGHQRLFNPGTVRLYNGINAVDLLELPGSDVLNMAIEDLLLRSYNINEQAILFIEAPTGLGKSTDIPTFLYDRFHANVFVLEPRIMICKNMADYFHRDYFYSNTVTFQLGKNLGYMTGLESVLPMEQPFIIFATHPLISVAVNRAYELTSQAKNPGIAFIYIDEIHEVTQTTTCIALGQIKLLLSEHQYLPRMAFICTSATINKTLLGHLFGAATIQHYYLAFKAPGHDVQIKRLELFRIAKTKQNTLKKTLEPLEELFGASSQHKRGIAFVFDHKADVIKVAQRNKWEVVYLSRKALQNNPHTLISSHSEKEHILFVSTQVAQMGITIERLDFVLDDHTTPLSFNMPFRLGKVLALVATSIATMIQRKGRVGRTQSGIYYYICPVVPHMYDMIPQMNHSLIWEGKLQFNADLPTLLKKYEEFQSDANLTDNPSEIPDIMNQYDLPTGLAIDCNALALLKIWNQKIPMIQVPFCGIIEPMLDMLAYMGLLLSDWSNDGQYNLTAVESFLNATELTFELFMFGLYLLIHRISYIDVSVILAYLHHIGNYPKISQQLSKFAKENFHPFISDISLFLTNLTNPITEEWEDFCNVITEKHGQLLPYYDALLQTILKMPIDLLPLPPEIVAKEHLDQVNYLLYRWITFYLPFQQGEFIQHDPTSYSLQEKQSYAYIHPLIPLLHTQLWPPGNFYYLQVTYNLYNQDKKKQGLGAVFSGFIYI